jgi:hypothetical protein
MFLERTGVFAGSASNTAAGVDVRLLEDLGVPGRIYDLSFLHINGFWGNRAPLLADNAIGGHGPGQTTAAVIERCAQAHRLALLANADDPAFFSRCNLPDRSGGANFGTEYATGLTITHARNQRRRPQALEARLVEGGMERGVGTDLHALAASDAPRQKVGFVE